MNGLLSRSKGHSRYLEEERKETEDDPLEEIIMKASPPQEEGSPASMIIHGEDNPIVFLPYEDQEQPTGVKKSPISGTGEASMIINDEVSSNGKFYSTGKHNSGFKLGGSSVDKSSTEKSVIVRDEPQPMSFAEQLNRMDSGGEISSDELAEGEEDNEAMALSQMRMVLGSEQRVREESEKAIDNFIAKADMPSEPVARKSFQDFT